MIKDGYHGDTSRTFLVGEATPQAKRLVRVTHECLWIGIDQVKPGAHLGDIGAAIQKYAEACGYSVVQEFCGHGIGRGFMKSRKCCITAALAPASSCSRA